MCLQVLDCGFGCCFVLCDFGIWLQALKFARKSSHVWRKRMFKVFSIPTLLCWKSSGDFSGSSREQPFEVRALFAVDRGVPHIGWLRRRLKGDPVFYWLFVCLWFFIFALNSGFGPRSIKAFLPVFETNDVCKGKQSSDLYFGIFQNNIYLLLVSAQHVMPFTINTILRRDSDVGSSRSWFCTRTFAEFPLL